MVLPTESVFGPQLKGRKMQPFLLGSGKRLTYHSDVVVWLCQQRKLHENLEHDPSRPRPSNPKIVLMASPHLRRDPFQMFHAKSVFCCCFNLSYPVQKLHTKHH